MNAPARAVIAAVCLITLEAACGGKGAPDAGPTSASTASLATSPATALAEADASGAPTNDGRITIVGDTPAQSLALVAHPVTAESATVHPNADGAVKAGIYKVPGGSYIAVPAGGTVRVRPDEARGVMIAGLPFQLDVDVRLVGEADPGGLSSPRAAGCDAKSSPTGVPCYGARYLGPGKPIEGLSLFDHREIVHQIILHADLTMDSPSAFRALTWRGLSDHFLIDFDGTLYQPLDVVHSAYHAGDANNRSVAITLNNLLVNLVREPDASPYPPVLPAGTSPTPPANVAIPSGPCRLSAGDVVCAVRGMGFGVGENGDTAVVYSASGDLYTTSDTGSSWSRAVAPFAPIGVVDQAVNGIVIYGANGGVAISLDAGETWKAVDAGSRATWRDASIWGETVVLVGDSGAIARSADSGQTFTAVATGAHGDFVAIGRVGDAFVASLGKGALVSKDDGVTWAVPTEPIEVAALVPPPGLGRCIERIPAHGERCIHATTTTPVSGVDTLVLPGDSGVAYLPNGVALTDDGGFSWRYFVSAERAAEMAKHPRGAAKEMVINSGKVRAYGYTEAQYRTLGALVRTLATVFPVLGKLGGVDSKGAVALDALEAPGQVDGILAHWHTETDRWDPGPGMDWDRLRKELGEAER